MGLHVGCCGFPKARSRYWERFRAVEVQKTFYQPPRIETLRRWRAEAPPGAAFTLKAWQLVTHPASSPTYRRLSRPVPPEARGRCGLFRPTPEVWAAWEATRAAARALEAEVILFQCPARFTPTREHVENLRRFFGSVDRGPFRLAWEPRGAWPPDLVARLCAEFGLVHAVDPFAGASATPALLYYRLHGRGGYRYRYTDGDLEELAALCRGKDGFVLFNNMAMWDDAARFLEVLSPPPGRPNR